MTDYTLENQSASNWVATGGTTPGLFQDTDDGTYVTAATGGSLGSWTTDPIALESGKFLYRYRVKVRYKSVGTETQPTSGLVVSTSVSAVSISTQYAVTPIAADWTDVYTPWYTIPIQANPVFPTGLVPITVGLGYTDTNKRRPRVSEVTVETDWNSYPVGTITAPTGTVSDTSAPICQFTYSDAEDNPMSGFRWRILTSDASAVLFNSDWIGATTPQDYRPAISLDNDDYIYELTVRQAIQSAESTADTEAVTIDITPPTAPTVSGGWSGSPLYAAVLNITPATVSGWTPYIEVWRKPASGSYALVWEGDPTDTPHVYTDLNGPLHEASDYKVRIIYTEDATGAKVASEYSTPITSTPTFPSGTCWVVRAARVGAPSYNGLLPDVAFPLPWTKRSDEEMAVYSALGRSDPVVVADNAVRTYRWPTLRLEFKNDEDGYNAFIELRAAQIPFVLTRLQTGEQWIMRIDGSITVTETNTDPIIYQVEFATVELLS